MVRYVLAGIAGAAALKGLQLMSTRFIGVDFVEIGITNSTEYPFGVKFQSQIGQFGDTTISWPFAKYVLSPSSALATIDGLQMVMDILAEGASYELQMNTDE